jgi:hypothetical protein
MEALLPETFTPVPDQLYLTVRLGLKLEPTAVAVTGSPAKTSVGCTAGQAYKFFVPHAANPSHEPYRMDPYASSIAPDATGNMNAIVASRDTAYDGGSYSTPPWNEAVIYELHISTSGRRFSTWLMIVCLKTMRQTVRRSRKR